MSSDQLKGRQINVADLNHLSAEEQAELIADEMSKVRNEFEPLQKSDIIVPEFREKDIRLLSVACVEKTLEEINANKSTPKGDIPPKIKEVWKIFKCSTYNNCEFFYERRNLARHN